jgi:hypothetical protein
MIVTVGVEHLAAAHALTRRGQLPFGPTESAETAELTERVAHWLRRYATTHQDCCTACTPTAPARSSQSAPDGTSDSASSQWIGRPAGQPTAAHHHDNPDGPRRDVHTSHGCAQGRAGYAVLPSANGTSSAAATDAPSNAPLDPDTDLDTEPDAAPNTMPATGTPRRAKPTTVEAAVRRGWTPTAAPAHLDHAGLIDPETLTLLACTPLLRAVTLAPDGAVLDLGRTQRLATATQKAALTARDRGCVIPGCPVPADACDAHHVVPWTAGGLTDITNLVLTCPRHHTETHQGTWTITMIHGVPWVTPPRWIQRDQPLLRNAMHHEPQARREHR